MTYDAHRNGELRKRFDEKWMPEPNSGCWLWIAAAWDRKLGYGSIGVGNRKVEKAHRVSWRLYRGEIPDSGHVLHKCDVSFCVNPDHLYIGTNADNIRDRDRRGRNGHANKTHCPQGHPYSGNNLYVNTRGGRVCRECQRIAQIKYNKKRSRRRRGVQ